MACLAGFVGFVGFGVLGVLSRLWGLWRAWRVLLSAVFLYELLGLFVEAVEEKGAGSHEAEH